jgi:parallel beta-helix repeat protein
MKNLLFCVFILFGSYSKATNYYFATITGDDNRTSSQAKNPSTPWKTLNKLNSIFSSLQPGDSVLLKRGDTFYGSISISTSGNSNAPIVIGAYGSGNKPVITSLVTVNNWISKGNGIWESSNSSFGSTVNMVLLNGVVQGMGRYPNSDADNGGYLTISSHSGKTSITDDNLRSGINWTGAELVIRSRRWILDRNPIISQSGSTLNYSNVSRYEPKDGFGYFIQNSIKTLDKFGEWYYDPSSKKLSIYTGSNNPSSYLIQATTKSNLVMSSGAGNLAFTNLTVKGANDYGFNISRGSDITIRACDIIFSGVDGIAVSNHKRCTIENCTISNSNNNGIKFANAVNSSTVKNNKVLNTSLIAGMGQSGDGNGIAIFSNGNDNVFSYNEIRNSGFIGISFKGSNLIVSNNLIDSFCLVKDDGAGIYSFGSYSHQGTKIFENIVMNGIGAIPGTGKSTYSTSGIYLDNNNSKIEITNNTIANCHDYGIYIHNSSNLTIKDNTLFNNGRRQLAVVQEADHPSSVRNNNINNNVLFSKLPHQAAMYFKSDQGGDVDLF